MRLKRRGIALVISGAVAGVPATAVATEGSLYPVAPGGATVTAPWTAIAGAEPGVWEVAVPAGNVTAGTKFRVPFACPVEGSEIELVQYDRLRVAAPSSFGADVLADGARISRDPDIDWPQSDGTRRRVAVGGGACDVTFDLVQSETRTQGKRTWFVGAVAAWARDLTAPTVEITDLPAVVGPGAEAVSLRYTVSDNFGEDGVGEHRIELNNGVVSRGSGVGSFAVPIPVEGLRERDHRVRVVVDGDGTAAGSAAGQFAVDRTGPELVITTTRRGAKRVAINVRGSADLGSWNARVVDYGVAQRAGAAGIASLASTEPVIASGIGTRSAGLDLSRVGSARLLRLVVLARDASGNLTSHLGPFIYTGARQRIQLTTNSRDIVAPFRTRRAGLGNRVETGVGSRVAIGGRLILRPSDRELESTLLSVVDPTGRQVARARTSARGTYVVRFRPEISGVHRVFVEGEAEPVRALKLFIRPRVGVVTRPASRLVLTRARRDLIVPGALKAGAQSANQRIWLQQRIGKRWRNVASDFTDAKGRFKLVFRPTRGRTVRTVVMRARVPADSGRAFSASSTRPFKVVVGRR